MGGRPRTVIIGAGFGGLAVARRLERYPVDVTIVDRHNFHQFQPLLYQVATAGLNPADVGYAVRGVFRRRRRVLFRNADVAGVDWDRRLVLLDEGDPLPFDHLVVAAGASTNYFGVPGAEEHGFPLYTLGDAVRLRNHVLSLFESADAEPSLVEAGALNLVVVGGGATGVEVAGALAELVDKVLADDFHDLDVQRSRIILVEQGPVLLGAFSPHSQRYARGALELRGVEVRTGVAVQRVEDGQVHLAVQAEGREPSHEVLPTACLVWAAGVRPSGLAAALGVALGKGGRVAVGDDLSLPTHPGSFAIGDIADVADGRGGHLPQLAQPAIQEGHHVADQIVRSIEGRPRTPFRYVDKGTMATIGRRAAVAELPLGIKLTGRPAWFAWLALHLVYLVGSRNRLSVLLNWAWNYFTWDRGPRLILRPEAPPAPTSVAGDDQPAPAGKP
jgi:NADH dehydrogenase